MVPIKSLSQTSNFLRFFKYEIVDDKITMLSMTQNLLHEILIWEVRSAIGGIFYRKVADAKGKLVKWFIDGFIPKIYDYKSRSETETTISCFAINILKKCSWNCELRISVFGFSSTSEITEAKCLPRRACLLMYLVQLK